MTDDLLDIAWAAGLFEGEGYIRHQNLPGRDDLFSRGMILSMADEDVVRRFHAIVGVGTVTHRQPQREGWSEQWRWAASRWSDLEPTLRAFLPWLGERRKAKAEQVLANGPQSRKKTHCKRGHEFTDENTYEWHGRGSPMRVCRTCQRARWQAHDARKRAAA